jgi:hypothetical protein
MLKIGTKAISDGAWANFSFRDIAGHYFPLKPGHQVAGWPDHIIPILLGDDVCGPTVNLITMAPGRARQLFAAHMHAADNWRTSLQGEFQMGSVHYAPGEFRLQRGWKNYPGDSFATGPDGGWMTLIFADRRGTRIRLAQEPELPETDPVAADAAAAAVPWMKEIFGLENDLFSEVTSEESAIVSTLPERERNWHVNSSFDRAPDWVQAGEHTRIAAILLGQRERGPVLLLARTEPGGTSSSPCAVGTELLHIVVQGSCSIGGKRYDTGDGRVELAGRECPDVVAGPAGVDELLVFGDRRHVAPASAGAGRTGIIERVVRELSERFGDD